MTNGSHTILDRVEIGRGFESDVVNDSNATFSYGEGEDIMTVWNGIYYSYTIVHDIVTPMVCMAN